MALKKHNIDLVKLQHLIKRDGITIIKKDNKYYKVKKLG